MVQKDAHSPSQHRNGGIRAGNIPQVWFSTAAQVREEKAAQGDRNPLYVLGLTLLLSQVQRYDSNILASSWEGKASDKAGLLLINRSPS